MLYVIGSEFWFFVAFFWAFVGGALCMQNRSLQEWPVRGSSVTSARPSLGTDGVWTPSYELVHFNLDLRVPTINTMLLVSAGCMCV